MGHTKTGWFLLLYFLAVSFAYADFGCHFVLGSRSQAVLNDTDKKISFRFTCREDMNLIAASFYCGDSEQPPAYLVGIQADKDGIPSGQYLGVSSVTPKGGCWITVPISDLPLLAGKVYHLVIERDVKRGGEHPIGVIGPHHFASVVYGSVLNPFNPREEKPDPRLNVLVTENGKWKVLDRQPLYALHGSGFQYGFKFQGVPYDSTEGLPVHGNGTPADASDDVLQGQALHPHYGFNATGIAVRVRREGHPTSPLYYRVYDNDYMHHITSLAFSGQALLPRQVPASFQWVTIGFQRPQPFPPECRYVVFQSSSGRAIDRAPGCEDCYLISEAGNSGGLVGAGDLSFDGGAHLSREAHSTDGGAVWLDDFERDADIVLLGPAAPSSESTPAGPFPIPTPALLFQEDAP